MPPTTTISISTNRSDHFAAARALSGHLNSRNIRHAYIGGFALTLLGSRRPTEINVLIENADPMKLREEIMEVDARSFADAGFQFYFITQDHDGRMVREELVLHSMNNVHVETLPTGTVGLPTSIISTYQPSEFGIDILHPAILILTKLKRWSSNYTSTRPKTVKKNESDARDIRHIINWLVDNCERIRFEEYRGKTKPNLLVMVRHYHNQFIDDVDHMGHLQSIMPNDWEAMLAISIAEESAIGYTA